MIWRQLYGIGIAGALAFLSATAGALAGKADVVAVEVTREAVGTFAFSVTVRHADTGWDHYADRWEVVGPDGKVLATRVLLHPHENEQPFTRSLSGVKIAPTITEVVIRARDSRHGHGGATKTVTVPH